MIRRNRILIALLLIVVVVSSIPAAFAAPYGAAGELKYDLDSIRDTWQSLPDEELNDYIGNNNDEDIFEFISGMSEKEKASLLSKETMLNNEVSIDRGDSSFDKMPYYDWIMQNGEKPQQMMMRARGINSTFTAKSGHCFYRFVDNNSGYIVRYKVTFTLNSTANAESLTNGYTVASVIYGTSGTNSNNTALDQVTFAKQKTYMQKANTVHDVLGDGTSEKGSDGKMMYRTAITPVFVLTVKVKKPAYTYGEWSVNGFTLADGKEQTLAKGSRFNFKDYNWQNTGDSTLDNKVYHSEVTDTMTSCVNILSCGFTVENTGSLGLAEGVPENDTINVVYKHPRLDLNFYANGGSVKTSSNNAAGVNPVERNVLYNSVFNKQYGLPLASNLGFTREGYMPKPGAEWKNVDGSVTWDEAELAYKATDLKDFTDGTFFTYSVRDMYVNWIGNVYKVILDNQGADFSGTENTWYRYNSFETVTLKDGSTQNNYFYTTDKLETPLAAGYKIVKPVKAGYTFKGYFTEKNGNGTQYVNAGGNFINQLWKKVGPHTLYAHWEKDEEAKGTLIIRRLLDEKDYYVSHGDATFLFRIVSKADPSKVYYRKITFGEDDEGSGGTISRETDCVLPYGQYSVEAMEVYRYKNNLKSIQTGNKVSDIKGEFWITEQTEEVVAVYDGPKINWAKFSHNDAVINELK